MEARVCSCQGAGRQRAMHRTSGACFGLHFGNPDFLAKQVFPAGSGIFVSFVCHHRGRSDWIDCGNMGERIGNMRSSVVTINYFFIFLAMWYFPLQKGIINTL